MTSAQIEVSFINAIREAERAVRRNVTHQALTQAQFDALVSYSLRLHAWLGARRREESAPFLEEQ